MRCFKISYLLFSLTASLLLYGQSESSISLLEISEPDSTQIDEMINETQRIYRYQPEYALKLIEKSLLAANEAKYEILQSRAYSLKGVVLKNKGLFAEAIESHLNSLRINEKIGARNAMATNYNDIGIIYKTMEEYDQALDSYLKANALCEEMNMVRGRIMTLNNIGTIYEAKNEFDNAVQYYNLAYTDAVNEGIKDAQAIILNNLGEIYAEKGESAIAQDYFRQTLKLDKETGDEIGSIYSMINMAGTFVGVKAFDSAAYYYQEAESKAVSFNANQLLAFLYGGMTEMYKQQNNYKKAFETSLKLQTVKDTLYNESRTQQLSEAEARYQTEKKDQEIDLLRQEQLVKELTIQQHQAERFALVSLIILGAMIIWYLYKRNKSRQNELFNKQLLQQKELHLKAIVETQESERKRIAKDLHDGIGQSLSGIRLAMENISIRLEQNNETEGAKVKELTNTLDQACHEVRNISHQMMPRVLQEDGLIPAIEDMLEKSFSHANITYQFDHFGLSERFAENVEISLYRITQELVNNIIKHSGATEVQVQLLRNKKQLVLLVEDNGKGFQYEKLKAKGIGLMNITSRVETVHGEFNLEPSPVSGTLATIRVPLN
ncbi:MAG: tetratricopeptide repeat protein [Bacteroidales bacterium]|nr:tetratricopeptide repeat protein [Bacteroidales bacterium]